MLSGGETPHRRCSTGRHAQWRRSASPAKIHWPPSPVEARRLTGDAPLATRFNTVKRHTGDAPLAPRPNGGEAPHKRRSTGHHSQWGETPDRRRFAGHQAQWGRKASQAMFTWRDDMFKAACCLHCLVLSAPASKSSRVKSKCPHRDDTIKAVCRLHCLVLVGVSSTDQLGHLQVPASRRHDQGCVPSALPCPCRRQLYRSVGPPPGARIETT